MHRICSIFDSLGVVDQLQYKVERTSALLTTNPILQNKYSHFKRDLLAINSSTVHDAVLVQTPSDGWVHEKDLR